MDKDRWNEELMGFLDPANMLYPYFLAISYFWNPFWCWAHRFPSICYSLRKSCRERGESVNICVRVCVCKVTGCGGSGGGAEAEGT